jgi:hypothetical protein
LPAPASKDQNFALTPAFRNWVNPGAADDKQLFDNLKQFEAISANYGNSTLGIEWTAQDFSPLAEYAILVAPKVSLPANASRTQAANAVLRGLKPRETAIRALATAARLPHFQTSTNRDAAAVLHTARKENAALERLHMLFQMRASALLATNRNVEAAEDVLTGLQLVRLARQIPDARSSLRAQTMLTRSLQPLWEGIVEQRWTAAQLEVLQNELNGFNLLADYTNAIHRVVLANIQVWQGIADRTGTHMPPPRGHGYRDNFVWQMQPRAWWYDNCIQLYQAGESAVEKVNVSGAHVRMDNNGADLDGLSLDNETTALLQPAWWSGASPEMVVFAQTAVHQAVIACALERFRIATGPYPETLETLVPKYLRFIPNDVVRGRPMLYEKTGDGHFILRSVGPNETDDRKNPMPDDWLWSFPTNAPPVAVPTTK